MPASDSNDKEIRTLRKKISIIEWDLPNLRNDKLRFMKEKELGDAKKRLEALLKLRGR